MKQLSHVYFSPNQLEQPAETEPSIFPEGNAGQDGNYLFWHGGLIIIISYAIILAGTAVFLKMVYCLAKEKCFNIKNDDKKCEC